MEQLNLFLQYFHTTMTEQLWYEINLFNGASRGAIMLTTTRRAPIMSGGIEQWDFFQLPQDLIRRRNPNGNEPLTLKNITNKMANAIRIAWTTELLNFSRNVWDWIGRDASIAGVVFGKAMAIQMMRDYLLRAFTIIKATVGANENTLLDVSTQTDPALYTANDINLIYAADQFGDAQSAITTWILPTFAQSDILVDQVKNVNRLYSVGSINVNSDINGRVFITTDDPNLREIGTDGVLKYWVLGLTTGAIHIQDLDDWDQLYDQQGGLENILRTYQANWSSRISVKGYKYDETQLTDSDDDKGKFASASDAALGAPENWSQYTMSHKETAGVALKARSNRPAYAGIKMYNHQ